MIQIKCHILGPNREFWLLTSRYSLNKNDLT